MFKKFPVKWTEGIYACSGHLLTEGINEGNCNWIANIYINDKALNINNVQLVEEKDELASELYHMEIEYLIEDKFKVYCGYIFAADTYVNKLKEEKKSTTLPSIYNFVDAYLLDLYPDASPEDWIKRKGCLYIGLGLKYTVAEN